MKAKNIEATSEGVKSLKGHVSFRNNLTEYVQSNLPTLEDVSSASDESDVDPAPKPVRRGTQVMRTGSDSGSEDISAQYGSLQIETEDDSDDSEEVKAGFFQIFKVSFIFIM